MTPGPPVRRWRTAEPPRAPPGLQTAIARVREVQDLVLEASKILDRPWGLPSAATLASSVQLCVSMHRFTPALPRLLALSLVVLAALLAAPNVTACPFEVVPITQELFRDAVRVYEAVALDDSFHFQVEKAWRGPKAETAHLPWAARQVGACAGQGPAVPGRRYLITIECSDPIEGDTFECPSRAEDLEFADERLRYLKESYPLTRDEVLAALRGWRDGSRTLEALRAWVEEVESVAHVDDWTGSRFDSRSLTLSSLRAVGYALQEVMCEEAFVRERIVPSWIALLESDEPTYSDFETIFESLQGLEEICWELDE